MKRFVFLLVALLFVCGSALAQNQSHDAVIARSPAVACPMIAKLCPDGTSVSPQGPNCEFPPCPGNGGSQMKIEPVNLMTDCAMDARKCPDGSWVSRVGPKCDFASCPGEEKDDNDETKEEKHEDEDKGDGSSSGSDHTGEEDAAPPIYVTPDKPQPTSGDSNKE